MSGEIALMVACARVRVDPGGQRRIADLAGGGIDWEVLEALCIRHKVLPLVFQNLTEICKDALPRAWADRLENGYLFENSLHNLSLVEHLHFVLSVLAASNIRAVPFKGPVLAQNVFDDVTLRRYLDLDILIAKKDALRAVEVFREKGFIPDQNPAVLEKLVAVSLVHPEKHLSIDLQWDISNRFSHGPIRLEDIQDRIEQVPLGRRIVPNLRPEELLCYLCIHGTKHRWLILDHVCCVSELVRSRQDLDWDHTLGFARKKHCTRVLLLGLCLARDLLEADLPDHIVLRINADKRIPALARTVSDTMFSSYMETMKTPEKFDPLLFAVKDGFPDKIQYCMKILFIPTKEDLRVFRLPEPLSFLRYILRPLRLLNAYQKRH